VHGLELRVPSVHPLQRPDSEELVAEAEGEEGDLGVEEVLDLQCMDVLGRAVGVGEGEVGLEQLPHVHGSWVLDRDLAFGHLGNLRDPERSIVRRHASPRRGRRICADGVRG